MWTALTSACKKPEHAQTYGAQAYGFSCKSATASFESVAIGGTDKHYALDTNLADAMMQVVKYDLARHLALKSYIFARRGLFLAGRQILTWSTKSWPKTQNCQIAHRACICRRCMVPKTSRTLKLFWLCGTTWFWFSRLRRSASFHKHAK